MIRRPRRTLAGAVLSVAVLLVASPAVGQAGGGEFTVPAADEAEDLRARPRDIAGELNYRGLPESTFTSMELTLEAADPGAEACAPGDAPAAVSNEPIDPVAATLDAPATAGFSFRGVSPFCNGSYVARVAGTVTGPIDDTTTAVSAPFVVALPAPRVTGLAVTVGPDRAVTLTWGLPAGWEGGAPPDFADFDGAGYVVERAVGVGAFESIATTGRDERTHVDTLAPADAATARYRVVATRSDGAGTVVAGDLAGAPVAEARFSPDVPAVPAPPPSVPVGRPPGAGTTRNVPATTIDEGFEESLPFDIEPGGPEAEIPEDAAQFLQDDGGGLDDIAGAGVLVPFSIATLLAAWALHLRYLARRAAVPG